MLAAANILTTIFGVLSNRTIKIKKVYCISLVCIEEENKYLAGLFAERDLVLTTLVALHSTLDKKIIMVDR